MDGYLELFDSAKYGRAYALRLLAKFSAVVTLNAGLYFLIANEIAQKLLGGVLLLAAVGIGYWAFFPKYPCPQCRRPMPVAKKPRSGAGGKDLFLACDGCKVCINLKVGEE